MFVFTKRQLIKHSAQEKQVGLIKLVTALCVSL